MNNFKMYTEELMEPYFSALEKCEGVKQMEIYHPEGDVFNHSLQVLSFAFRETNDVDLILAAMLHDVGKTVNTKGHEQIAVEMLDEYLTAKTKWLIEQHMRVWYLILGEMRKRSKVHELVNHPLLPDLILLARWDKMGRIPKKNIYYSRESIIDRLNKWAEKAFLGSWDSVIWTESLEKRRLNAD